MMKQVPWFVEQRAEWFASLLLTKRNDVKVQPYAGKDMAINLLVEILRAGKSTLRFFGVQVVPYMDLPDRAEVEKRGLSHPGSDPFEAGIPICVFVIGVRKPEGIFRWYLEPVIEDGRPLLQRDFGAAWHTLDEVPVGRLIDQVNGWYEAHNNGSPPHTRDRHLKTGSG